MFAGAVQPKCAPSMVLEDGRTMILLDEEWTASMFCECVNLDEAHVIECTNLQIDAGWIDALLKAFFVNEWRFFCCDMSAAHHLHRMIDKHYEHSLVFINSPLSMAQFTHLFLYANKKTMLSFDLSVHPHYFECIPSNLSLGFLKLGNLGLSEHLEQLKTLRFKSLNTLYICDCDLTTDQVGRLSKAWNADFPFVHDTDVPQEKE